MKSWLRNFLCLSSNLFLVQSKQLKQLIHSDPKDSLERRNRIPKIKNPEKFSNIMPTLKNELDRSEKWKNVRFFCLKITKLNAVMIIHILFQSDLKRPIS